MLVLTVSLLVVIAVILICSIIHGNRYFKVTRYEIKSEKLNNLTESVRIVVLADLHNHVYGNDNDILVKAIEKEKPDMILVAGDLMVAKPDKDFSSTLSLLKRLSGSYPIYYGMGNHEYRLKIYPERYQDMYEHYFRELKKFNIHILDNKNMEIHIKNTVINIFGLEIDKEYYKRLTTMNLPNNYMESLLGSSKEKEYNILLAHNPNYFNAYAIWGADLTLSGHIHGGLVRLPFLGGVVSPQVEFFPKYDSGLFYEEEKIMVLSSGLGTHTINVRVNNPAELISIELGGQA